MKVSATRLAGAAALSLLLASAPAPAAAPAGRYTASGGVVKDNKTGLSWQQAAAPMTYSLASAITYCSGNVAALPGTGWRLPAIKELQTLVDDSVATGPRIDTVAFPATSAAIFWSSTPYAPAASSSGWYVDFSNGATLNIVSTSLENVRCVR